MTRLVAVVLTWLAVLATLAVSGGYTVHYLLTWQWVRAQMAGIAFVAALVLAATLLIVRRLRRLEYRLAMLAATVPAAVVAPSPGGPAAAAPAGVTGGDAGGVPAGATTAPSIEPRPDFPWLTAPGWALPALALVADRAVPGPPVGRGVFIPVFLATGIVVSLVASLVEKLSAARRHVASPAGGGTLPTLTAPPRARDLVREAPVRGLLVVPVIGAVVIGLVIGGLYWASHYRSRPVGSGTTTLTVRVDHREPAGMAPAAATPTVEAAGRYCAATTRIGVHYRGVRPAGEHTVLLRVTPLLDEDATARFSGCLEDAIVDRVWLQVENTTLRPGPQR